jgi:ribosomal protein S18 acetylase RimI-like enzyme
MEIATRSATSSDREFARRVHHTAYRDVVQRQFGRWLEEEQDAFFAVGWDTASHTVVTCDGIACGNLCVDRREADLHVREIVLSPEFQRRGIGSRLLRQVMDEARERGVPVRLGTLHENRAAGLYRRLGFLEIGRTQTHILFEWRDRAS